MESRDDIFLAAREVADPRERAAYLARACGSDAMLRAEVEGMLRDAVGADAFFAPIESRPTETWGPPVSEKPGDRIGRYKLLQQIGEGGCGVVYMAEQEEPVRRRVALKVIKLGMDTKSVIARFEAERQALALMDHPNIAKVHDAGATETGRPYFVMELVRGIKITDYCDQSNLSTRERLDLFIPVCHAIQHAHQKGIIHRDIKPSNILVTLHDGTPVPKVIDFGIAKATTQQRLTDKTYYTAFEQFIGTPAYMSPEQAEMSGLDIDTRSDIYALGVLLYELLTGKTPFDSKDLLAAGLDEMRRTIREKEPARPSTRLNTLQGDELTTTAKRRGTEPPRLIHLVQGDLDWIVMKCLEKDRTRRYETANGLALDIERHLRSEPVVARPPSTVYRLQKSVRRNKVMVMAGGGVAAALVLGIVVSTWQAVRATRAEREQGRLRVKAEANEQKAVQARADEAKQRLAAVDARTQAEEQRRLAQTNELLARQHAYAADVKLADIALRENNLGQALTALRRQLPRAGETDLRGIEWRYLWQKSQGSQSDTFRHEAPVTYAELSPDGRWLATESGGASYVWDTTRERQRLTLSAGPPDATWLFASENLAFDPQGRFLATATWSNVWIWTIPQWRQLWSLPATNASLSFSGDGAMLATFGDEGIQVWETATWQPLVGPGEIRPNTRGSLQFGWADIRHIALNRDGSLLAESCQDRWKQDSSAEGEVALWQVAQRQPVFKSSQLKDVVRLAFSADDRWLAACTLGPPAVISLWSVPEGKAVAQWRASEGQGRALAFAPGGRVLATAASDQVIRLWEIANTNRPLELLQGHVDEVCSLRFATDGRLVSASRDKTACLWSIGQSRSDPPAFSFPPGRLISALTPDFRRMVTVNLTNLTFEEWDLDSGQRLREQRIQGADAILHHGTLINGKPLTAGLMNNWIVMDNYNVGPGVGRVWVLWRPPGAHGWDLSATTGDGRVYAWKAESGELVYSNKVASSLLAAYPMADHRKLLLLKPGREAPYMGGPLSSYDLQTHQTKLIDDCVPHASWNVSPDGHLFAYIATNNQVRVWDVSTEQAKYVVRLPDRAYCIEFSPDSRWLAVSTAAGWLQVFDAGTGQAVSDPLAEYWAGVYRVTFSADSRSLVTCGNDSTARIWNIATSREMVSGLPVSRLPITVLPPDGNSVVEGAGEWAIRVARLPTLAEIDARENGQIK